MTIILMCLLLAAGIATGHMRLVQLYLILLAVGTAVGFLCLWSTHWKDGY